MVTMSCDYTAFLEARKAALLLQIEAIEGAIVALTEGAYSYTMDTGQTRQTVTKADLSSLQRSYDAAWSRYQYVCQQLDGSNGTTRIVPGW